MTAQVAQGIRGPMVSLELRRLRQRLSAVGEQTVGPNCTPQEDPMALGRKQGGGDPRPRGAQCPSGDGCHRVPRRTAQQRHRALETMSTRLAALPAVPHYDCVKERQ